MSKLQDYNCKYGQDLIDYGELIKRSGVDFPRFHAEVTGIAAFAKARQKATNGKFCYLPFCHTLEAEAMGGSITLGKDQNSTRAGSFTYQNLEQLQNLPKMDLTKGRIAEVLKACEILSAQGDIAVLAVTGPFTVLNSLVDISVVLKAWRKQPDVIAGIFDFIGNELLGFMHAATKRGITIFSYADPTGGLNILGPKLAEAVVQSFTLPFLQKLKHATGKDTLTHLCPKTSLTLTGLGLADWKNIELKNSNTYEEACAEVIKVADFVGQMCIMDCTTALNDNIIKALVLNEEES